MNSNKRQKINIRTTIEALDTILHLLALAVFSLIVKTLPGYIVSFVMTKYCGTETLPAVFIFLLVNGFWVSTYKKFRKKNE